MAETGPRAGDEALRWRIAARAYGLWEEEGCPHGRDLEHWLRAQAEIIAPNDPPDLAAPPERGRKRIATPKS